MDYTRTGACYDREFTRMNLSRVWNVEKPTACVIMYYPSTADSCHDDMTITRLQSILQHNGYGSMQVINTSVGMLEELRKVQSQGCDDVLIAWGNKLKPSKSSKVIEAILNEGIDRVGCFGLNMTGTPVMPTRLPSKTDVIWM